MSSEPTAVVASATVPGGLDVVDEHAQASVDLVFTPPDFSLAVSPDVTVQRGMSRQTTVTVTPVGFAQTVDLSIGVLPAGVSASFDPRSVVGAGTSPLTLTANIEAPLVESTTVTVFGDGLPFQTHSATFRLAVAPAP